jgi:LmbE family N-acetylglucosaminyl deacetylase
MSTRHGDAGLPFAPTDAELPAFIRQFRDPAPVRPVGASSRTGTPLVLLQPHPDDCALSIGGTLLKVGNPVSILTVFSVSATAALSAARQAEDRRFATVVGAEWRHLGGRERRSTSAEHTPAVAAQIADATRSLSVTGGGVLLAPAAVARHVDHRTVHQAARSLDAVAFWEDVAFWSIYGASVEDRVQFALRSPEWLADQVLVAVDITDSVRAKAALLACYRSQSDETWRPLRYAWAAARELGRQGYCERLFVPADLVAEQAPLLGLDVEPGPVLQYGTIPVRTAWATPRALR